MKIASSIPAAFPNINAEQAKIVAHDEGPLLVIAGPGSGKTFSLVLRAMNLLINGRAQPSELIICTFTEKAAFELRDRIASAARQTGFTDDLSELKVGTIHGICNRILIEHRHRTELGSGYETLDDLTQLLFIFDNFQEILGVGAETPFLGRWNTKWRAIEGLREYFNKITEELVDAKELATDSDDFIRSLGVSYENYRRELFSSNLIDFSHQQSLVHDLLLDPAVRAQVTKNIKYLLVDEYQDTNYVQEQVLTQLSSTTGNLCVVGDEDQSLYRFRGATVRNILEFPQRFSDCKTVKLTTNYRSHATIIASYDKWMSSANWSNPEGSSFRYEKTISPDPQTLHPDYPSTIAVWGKNPKDEAHRVADLVAYLKKEHVIQDYSQVAILLRSVRFDHSGTYISALSELGIPSFCPRARGWFDNEEVRLMVGAFAVLFGYHGDGRGGLTGRALANLARYVDSCIADLSRQCAPPHPFSKILQELTDEISSLEEGESLDTRPADYFYKMIASPPFSDHVKNANRARNLATFSQLLNVFQNYYHYSVITHRNRQPLRFHLFNSFLRLLYDGGINDYEDDDQPIPKGYVQMMTIHQAKGLEFPVTIVGSLDVSISTGKQVDRDLQRFYRRPPFEPQSRITSFDRMRLHYVAFSRAEKLLVLSSDKRPKAHFAPIWQGLPQWPYVQKELLAAQRFAIKDRIPLKRRYSFTGDLRVYETCPRQYEFFREYDFTPSRSAVIFFGLLVHQTIEEIHRLVIDGQLGAIDDALIVTLFDRTFNFLSQFDVRPIGEASRKAALVQVLNYFRENHRQLERVIDTEVDVSVEKEGYILTGKVDLLMGSDGKLEILDFKTAEKPTNSPDLLAAYERQLCIYAHILERRYGKTPERLLLYWTGEERRQDALMEFPYKREVVEGAGRHFDDVVAKIKDADFRVITPPERKICKECDLKTYCVNDGLIGDPDASNVVGVKP